MISLLVNPIAFKDFSWLLILFSSKFVFDKSIYAKFAVDSGNTKIESSSNCLIDKTFPFSKRYSPTSLIFVSFFFCKILLLFRGGITSIIFSSTYNQSAVVREIVSPFFEFILLSIKL